MVRVLSWLFRSVFPFVGDVLSAKELRRSKKVLVIHAQEELVPELKRAAESGSGRFKKLAPVLDKDGIWRVGSILGNIRRCVGEVFTRVAEVYELVVVIIVVVVVCCCCCCCCCCCIVCSLTSHVVVPFRVCEVCCSSQLEILVFFSIISALTCEVGTAHFNCLFCTLLIPIVIAQ